MSEDNHHDTGFKRGFVVGIIVSLLLIAFYNTASGNDRFIVLDYGPIIEGAPQERFKIMDAMTEKCYDFIPGSVLHDVVLEEVECPA